MILISEQAYKWIHGEIRCATAGSTSQGGSYLFPQRIYSPEGVSCHRKQLYSGQGAGLAGEFANPPQHFICLLSFWLSGVLPRSVTGWGLA